MFSLLGILWYFTYLFIFRITYYFLGDCGECWKKIKQINLIKKIWFNRKVWIIRFIWEKSWFLPTRQLIMFTWIASNSLAIRLSLVRTDGSTFLARVMPLSRNSLKTIVITSHNLLHGTAAMPRSIVMARLRTKSRIYTNGSRMKELLSECTNLLTSIFQVNVFVMLLTILKMALYSLERRSGLLTWCRNWRSGFKVAISSLCVIHENLYLNNSVSEWTKNSSISLSCTQAILKEKKVEITTNNKVASDFKILYLLK